MVIRGEIYLAPRICEARSVDRCASFCRPAPMLTPRPVASWDGLRSRVSSVDGVSDVGRPMRRVGRRGSTSGDAATPALRPSGGFEPFCNLVFGEADWLAELVVRDPILGYQPADEALGDAEPLGETVNGHQLGDLVDAIALAPVWAGAGVAGAGL